MSLLKIVLIFLISCVLSHAYKMTPRIVNGEISGFSQFPYFAYLDIRNKDVNYICGGALITPRFVLTATHCLKDADKMYVYLGITNIYTARSNRVKDRIKVESNNFYMHPQYYGKPMYWNDVSLIHLPRKAKLNKYIQPIKLPSDCLSIENSNVIVMGYGKTASNESVSNYLQYAQMETTSKYTCLKEYPLLFLRRSVICAKPHKTKPQTTCDVTTLFPH